jgi:hypothetical protein
MLEQVDVYYDGWGEHWRGGAHWFLRQRLPVVR